MERGIHHDKNVACCSYVIKLQIWPVGATGLTLALQMGSREGRRHGQGIEGVGVTCGGGHGVPTGEKIRRQVRGLVQLCSQGKE